MILFQFLMNPFRFVGLLSVCLMISLIETGVFIVRGIQRNRRKTMTLNRLAKYSGPQELSVVRNNELIKFSESEISYFIHDQGIIFLVTNKGERVITQFDSLNEIESQLSDRFFRATRQIIIAHESVLSLQNEVNNKLKLSIKHLEKPICVSRYKNRSLKEWFKS